MRSSETNVRLTTKLFGLVAVLALSACMKKEVDADSFAPTPGFGGVQAPPPPTGIQPVVKVVNPRAIAKWLTSMSDVPISAATQNIIASDGGSLSADGKGSDISAKERIALAKITAQHCNDIYQREKTVPRLYAGINLNQTTIYSAAMQAAVIKRLALAFWQRNPTTTEFDRIVTEVTAMGFPTLSTSQSQAMIRDGLLATCTAILASLDATKR